MLERGVPVKINGQEYRMVFTTAALLYVTKNYGSVEELGDVLDGSDNMGIEIALDLIALLVNQGIMLETSNLSPNNPDLMSIDKLLMFIDPGEIPSMINIVFDAIAAGMHMERKTVSAEVDVVLEEFRSKNAEGAAE